MKSSTLRCLVTFMVGLALAHSTSAQHAGIKDTSLVRALDAYLLATQRGDFHYVLDQVHPGLFELMPKAVMYDAMVSTFNDPEVPMAIDTVLLLRAKGPVVQSGVTYHFITYQNHMRMHVAPDSTENGALLEAGEQAEKDDLLLTMLLLAYGKDKVRFDAGTRDYMISTGNEMFAVKDPAIGDWKFIGYKPEMKSVMDRMVPAKVRKKLGAK